MSRLINADALLEKFNMKADMWTALTDEDAAGAFAFYCKLADAVEEMPTVGGWISVKDRLPDNKDRYLCACFDYVTKTYWIDILWHVSGSWWTRLSSMDTDKNANNHVRYWMPLPGTEECDWK